MKNSTIAIKNEFNTTAAKLGCKARIGGNKAKIEFQEYIGDSKGFELVVKIDANRFGQLIAKYPQLQD